MSVHKGTRVLAIGLDAAEPKFIHRLIEQDEMPALKALLAEGRWLRVQSSAHIGSGSVWPTFLSGQEPSAHGVHGEWSWQPETMTLVRYGGGQHKIFWQDLAEKGFTVGVLDPPFVTLVGLSEGFEIIEWGAHDQLKGRVQAGPKEVADFLAGQPEFHPWTSERHDNASSDDPAELARLNSSCLKGVKLRGSFARALIAGTHPDFAFITFPEIHHSAHYLWHTSEFDPQLHSGLNPDAEAVRPSLKEIFREVDRQIAVLIEAAGPGHRAIVFSLHGMRACAGVPAFLQPLLCEKGFACLAPWSAQSWPRRASSIMAAVKRNTPVAFKNFYYQALTSSATRYLARPTMLPAYDWSRTRAFSLPTDQHGWIRINLRGRESAGIVAPEQYRDTCRQLEELMRSLCRVDGLPLVTQVVRTAANFEEARSLRLPDLVVHWSDAAFAAPAKIKGSEVRIQTIGKKFTGQHAPDGFCILAGENNLGDADCLLAKDMHLLITNWLLSETSGVN
jgi:predicted AlkP superfamily phosphohydrolase/phosphomutase